MAQLIQPLTGVTNEPPTGGICELRIIIKGALQPLHPFNSATGHRYRRRCRQLLRQELMKLLLTSLKVLKTAIRFETQ